MTEIAISGRECKCLCGGFSKGGQFIPGHDARHKSNLIKRAMAGDADALDELEARNWTRFLDKAREVLAKDSQRQTNRRNGMPSAAEVLDWDSPDAFTEETIGDAIVGNTIRIRRMYKGRNLGDEDIAVGKLRLVAEGEVDFWMLTGYDGKTKRPILGACRTVRMTDIVAILKQEFKTEVEVDDE